MNPDRGRTIEKGRLGILAPARGSPGHAPGVSSDRVPSETSAPTYDPEAGSGGSGAPEFTPDDGRARARTGGLVRPLRLVADALVALIRHVPGLDTRHAGPLRHYLRQAIQERLEHPEPRLVGAVDAEGLERYRRACIQLLPSDRELIVATVELGYNYEQVALATDRPSAHAARSAVKRAVLRLAEVMARA